MNSVNNINRISMAQRLSQKKCYIKFLLQILHKETEKCAEWLESFLYQFFSQQALKNQSVIYI